MAAPNMAVMMSFGFPLSAAFYSAISRTSRAFLAEAAKGQLEFVAQYLRMQPFHLAV
jgi:hypothetical protein